MQILPLVVQEAVRLQAMRLIDFIGEIRLHGNQTPKDKIIANGPWREDDHGGSEHDAPCGPDGAGEGRVRLNIPPTRRRRWG